MSEVLRARIPLADVEFKSFPKHPVELHVPFVVSLGELSETEVTELVELIEKKLSAGYRFSKEAALETYAEHRKAMSVWPYYGKQVLLWVGLTERNVIDNPYIMRFCPKTPDIGLNRYSYEQISEMLSNIAL